jgi:Trypsin-like peptidase domain
MRDRVLVGAGRWAVAAADQEKDAWDKAQIVGTIASGLLVALLGALFTYLYNRQQQRVEERRRREDAAGAAAREAAQRREVEEQERRSEEARQRDEHMRQSELSVRRVEVVRSLLADLKSDVPRDRRAALLAVEALGDPTFAADLARIYGGPGGVSALVGLSLGDRPGAEQAQAAALLSGLTRRLRHSVAVVHVGEGRGSAFSVAEDLVLTAAHVVGDAREGMLRVGAADYRWRLEAASETHGLALLHTYAAMVPIELASAVPAPDEDVLVVGWDPRVDRWVANPGTVLGRPAWDAGGRWLLPAEIGSVPGFSGAPVVNRTLEVVAVHFAKVPMTNDEHQQGLARMIALPTVVQFLEENGYRSGAREPAADS